MPSSAGLLLERTSEHGDCRQFTLRSTKVVLTLCYLALLSPAPAHVEAKNLDRGRQRWPAGLRAARTTLMGNGLRSADPLLQPRVVTKVLLQKRRWMSPKISHQILTLC